MLELIQFPWSNYCLVARRILEFSGVPFKITNIPVSDRSSIWKLTRKRYYKVPVLKDGSKVIFETGQNSQVIAKYLDYQLRLNLFPAELEGLQSILWKYIENDLEEVTFKLNDIYYQEFVSLPEQLPYLRHKERHYGAGCLSQWRHDKKALLAEASAKLIPFEQMLLRTPFLLGDQPRFVDFDLHGVLSNFLYSGHHQLPAAHGRLKKWFKRVEKIKHSSIAS